MVHQWAQYRYGVFEEYGYPGDYLLPYFYHHPQGYYALTSTNDTEIHGSLIKYCLNRLNPLPQSEQFQSNFRAI